MKMLSKKQSIKKDSRFGYWHLDPIPTEAELDVFYKKKYYDLVKKGNRAPELRKIMTGGKIAKREETWLKETLHNDISHTLLKLLGKGAKILDIGCGTGNFLSYLKKNEFKVFGLEPSCSAANTARKKGIPVENATLKEFTKDFLIKQQKPFDAVVMLNVLEHVPDPLHFIKSAKKLLNQNGVLCIRVPNDYTEIQLAAQKATGLKSWWITVPDHINYFNFKSLSLLLKKNGFHESYAQGDFPMEFYLLMGENYVGNLETGKQCHEKRIRFEENMPPDFRRELYAGYAKMGIGRNCLVFSRLK